MTQVLIIIDPQVDFCSEGKLAVPDGEAIIPLANRLQKHFQHIILTQDWHPEGHLSFASAHTKKAPFETVDLDYGKQILWPDHCLQGSEGAAFHPELDTQAACAIVRKGFRKSIDSYSGFMENDHKTPTGLEGMLRELGVEHLFLCGLALDFCVSWTAVDARRRGFTTTVIQDACRGIDTDNSLEQAMKNMVKAGVLFQDSSSILNFN